MRSSRGWEKERPGWCPTQRQELTCFAHRSPQLLHRSRCPLGPLLHSGVLRVWQFAQSLTTLPTPFLLFRFFLLLRSWPSSSANSLFTFSICRSSYCQDEHRVVLSSSNMLSSLASAASWDPRDRPTPWGATAPASPGPEAARARTGEAREP